MEAVLGAGGFYDAGDGGCAGPALREIGQLLDEMPSGETLEIRSSTGAGRASLRAFVRMRGDTVEAEDAGPDRDRILIRKG